MPRGAIHRRFLPSRNSTRPASEDGFVFQDDDANAEVTPAPGERVLWSGILIAEAYLPADVDRLLDGLEELGWDESVRERGQGTDVKAWLRGVREGVGRPTAIRVDLPSAPPLPDGFGWIAPSFHALSSQLTLGVYEFRPTEEGAARLDTALRKRVVTSSRTRRHAVPILVSVDMLKREALDDFRRAVRNDLQQWISEHVPGAFSRGDGPMPSCELLSTTQTALVDVGQRTSWPRTLGAADPSAAWISRGIPTMGAFVPAAARGASALLLTYRSKELQRWAGEHPAEGPLLRFEIHMLVVHWALSLLPVEYLARISAIRDRAGRYSTRWRAGRDLERVRTEMLPVARDARLLASDLRQLTVPDSASGFPMVELVRIEKPDPSDPDREPKSWSLVTELHTVAMTLGEELAEAQHALAEALIVDSNLVQAVANLRLQRFVTVISVVALVVALGSLLHDGVL